MPNERQRRIKEYIDTRGEASTEELTALCDGRSNMTLWRDLKTLEEAGAIRRTRGGAISMRYMHPDEEGLYSQRALENVKAKRAVAQAASAYVKTGSSIYLDAGSTVMAAVKYLPDEHFTIITSGANIAIELSKRRNCSVMCTGGQISANTLSFSGTQAEAFIDTINIDTALMATSGLSLGSGFTAGSSSEHRLKRKVIEKATHVIMLMDISKLGKSLPFTFANMADIDVLVCDAPLPKEFKALAKKEGVEVIVVEETAEEQEA